MCLSSLVDPNIDCNCEDPLVGDLESDHKIFLVCRCVEVEYLTALYADSWCIFPSPQVEIE